MINERFASYYPMTRTAHVERLAASEASKIYFRDTRGDWDPGAAPDDKQIVHSSTLRVCARVFSGQFDVLEIPEPLAVRLLPDLISLSTIWRLTPRSRRPRYVSYAIENREQTSKVSAMLRSAVAGPLVLRSLLSYILPTIECIAFGTEGSLLMYESECGKRSWSKFSKAARTRVFEALPQAASERPDKVPSSVLFIGTFQERKGFPQLMRSWSAISRADEKARLTVVCPPGGELESEAKAWSSRLESVDLYVNPSRRVIHELLESANVLVLPSRRTATWREQVGLPIVEGLSHGCTVVTSAETGIASWLAAHGHRVIPSNYSDDELAKAVLDAIGDPLSPTSVLESLPTVDQRAAADTWMFSPELG